MSKPPKGHRKMTALLKKLVKVPKSEADNAAEKAKRKRAKKKK